MRHEIPERAQGAQKVGGSAPRIYNNPSILEEFGITAVILTSGACGRGGPVLQPMTLDPAVPLRVPNY